MLLSFGFETPRRILTINAARAGANVPAAPAARVQVSLLLQNPIREGEIHQFNHRLLRDNQSALPLPGLHD